MANPFMGEIKMGSFNFAPKGYALCNGQLLSIAQNQALFSLMGTQYGGNGQTNFQLPNLQGRVPIHRGSSHPAIGEVGGQESHTLVMSEMPAHNHLVNAADNPATTNVATGAMLAQKADTYTALSNIVAMGAAEVGSVGGNQPHENMQPYLVINYFVALQGIFPSQN